MRITEDQFLKAELEELNLTMDNKDFVALAIEVADYVKKLKPLSIIDYGCCTGVYSEVLRCKGLNIVAQDVFKSHSDYCKENYPELRIIEEPEHAELMLFIEVAEHMTDEEIKTALGIIQPETILFSSTPYKTDNDEDWGHINIKQESEWIAFFNDLGYSYQQHTNTPTKWALLFVKI